MTEKILLDTDIGSDCDDAGALALLHTLSKAGRADILGITHCGSDIGGAVAIKSINQWYGRDDIPVGKYVNGVFLEEERCRIFTNKIMEMYLERNEMPKIQNAVKLMRKALAENTDVTMVTIGMMNNIADLLKSEPDEISDKTGYELVCESVKCLYSMAGNFADADYMEYNICADIKSAAFVAEKFPKTIIYAGFELGKDVITGENLKRVSEKCPIKIAYNVFDGKKESWDPITVYCAVIQDTDKFIRKNNMKITFDDKGRAIHKQGGKDAYLIMNKDIECIRKELDEYLRA